jgi:SAM-dependent methyltransferase
MLRAMNADVQEWLETPLGRRVWLLERKLVHEALAQVFGWQLLQIGLWGEADGLVSAARTQRKLLLARSGAQGVGLVSRSDELGLASDSVDAVLLPHTLEYEADPHEILREVERILSGDGQLIVLGFRPMSAWGMRHALAREGFPPGLERFIGEGRLRDWLKLLGFEVTHSRRYLFTVPWGGTVPASQRFLESAGERVWPLFAGAYLLKARKRVYCLTPMRPRWQRRPSVVGGLAEPTARTPG